MRRIVEGLRRVLFIVFGEVTWRPPLWLLKIRQGSGAVLSALGKRKKIVVAVVVISGLAVGIYVLWPEKAVTKRPDQIALTARAVPPEIKAPDAKENPPLRIRFDKSAARMEQVDKAISPTGLTLEPEMAGTWRWQGDRELVFTPKKDWPIAEAYTLTIDPAFLPEHTVLEKNELDFATPPFKMGVRGFEFVSDPVDPARKTAVATLWFSHPVDRGPLEKKIAMTLGTKDTKAGETAYQFEIQYNPWGTEAYVHSHNIPIPMKDTPMTVAVRPGVPAAKGGPGTEERFERSVTVPGMYSYFRVQGAGIEFARNRNNDPEQIIVLRTRPEVHEQQIKKRFKAWLLPKDKPATKDEEVIRDYSWSPQEVDAKVLKMSEPLELELIPRAREYSALHTLKFKAPVGRRISMRLEKWTKAWGGYVLAKPFDTIAVTGAYPKELAIMHEGALLSTSGARKVSVTTRGIPGVEIELARVMKSEINHLISQTSGRFDKPYFNYRFGPEDISEIFREQRPLDASDPSKSQYTAVDFAKIIQKHGSARDKGLFVLKVKSWNPTGYISEISDTRLVLITDLGILAKKDAAKNHHVFVQSIASGAPRPNVEVAALGKNGLEVVTRRTDASGLAVFPPLEDFVHEKSPVAFVVTAGDDFAYLPFGRSDRYIDYSRFDVGGVTTDGSADNLDAYLFSDRGIYRPGDAFHVGLIVKAADWTRPVDGLPIEVVVTDPRGQEVLTQKTALENSGFIETAYKTEEGSPTGRYSVSAFVLKKDDKDRIKERTLLGSTSVRVEEFLPDAMTIRTAFTAPPTDGWISPEGVAATVSLRNLYGTPATDRRVAGRISLATAPLSFKGYRGYRFHDPASAERGYVKTLDDAVTDDNGEARFDIDLKEFDAATYALTFVAEGFEGDGGRSVTSESSITVSPLHHVVGYKADGGLRYIGRDSERAVDLVAVNRRLRPVAVSNLRATLYEQRYVSTLVKQYNGVFKYQSVMRKAEVSKARIGIKKEGLRHPLDTSRPGEFVLEIAEGNKVVTTIAYSVAGAANLERSLERTAELEVRLDKKDYSPGDEIQIHIKAPYTGAGLITIERDKVYRHKWFRANDTSVVETIQVPSNIDVNAYVNVALVRDLDSEEIFMSPLSSAVVPFSLTREAKVSAIDLEVPALVKPGDDLVIGYATEAPSKIAVFAVDEGILQVAGYTTPDPLSHFLSKRALEVSTSQILDMILPEHEAYENPSKDGGGDEGEGALGRNLNPFKRKREKPVVFWSGIIDAGPTKQSLTFRVPDTFNGTVRTMAVAVSRERLGAGEKKTVVRGPFVIHSSPPLFAAPGDSFDVSVTVANNVEGSGKDAPVKLSVEVTSNLEVVGEKRQALAITEGREKSARFKLRAKARLGNATITFKAAHKKEVLAAKSTMSIRPKNPRVTTVKAGAVEDGTATVPIARRLYPEYRHLELSLSPLPLVLADGLSAYLREFPHGCTEQLVSQAVPALVLLDHKGFGYDPKTATAMVAQTIAMLQSRQNSEGAFGYWAANSHVSDQQTVYAVQFLTEAGERGYSVPSKVMAGGLAYLRSLRENDLDRLAAARLRAYALYVLALNGELSAASLAELREHLARDKENKWHRDVVLGYLAATYKLMQDRREAQALADKIDLDRDTVTDYDDFYDDQVYRGTMLHLLAKHFPDRLARVGTAAIQKIADGVARGRYNTLSSARIIYGLSAYASRVTAALAGAVAPEIEVRQVLSKKDKPVIALRPGSVMRATFSEKARAIEITAKSDYPIFYQVSLSGFDLDTAKDVPASKGVEILREYRNLDKKPVTQVTLGQEIEAVVKLRSTREDHIGHLAIVDLLPAGFEVVLNRSGRRVGTADSTWSPEYADLREDRVLLYGYVGQDVREFVYRIKATSRGAFAVPPAYCASMYDPEVSARTASSAVTVVDPR